MQLALFFTYGTSLKIWNDTGLTEREKLLYERMISDGYIKHTYWFTYGADDGDMENLLDSRISVVAMPGIFNSRAGRIIYSILMPLIHYNRLKRVDILKTNQMRGVWTALIARLLVRKKLIARAGYIWSLDAVRQNSGSLKSTIIEFIERVAYRFSDAIIVPSAGSRDYIRDRYKISREISVIPNFVDTDLFRPLEKSKPAERDVCFVGRFSSEKNLISLLKACSGTDISLTLTGSGEIGEELKSYARSNGMNVTFTGNIPNSSLPQLLNRHKVFILPSLYEGMPKALLEAMSCGMPCIGTDVSGIREIINHRDNGYLCGTEPDSIRKAIKDVLEDHELREHIGRNARRTVMEKFSLTHVTKSEGELYKSLCPQNSTTDQIIES
jgi:glycosyltransferase involved in cell wall biosynthesis